MAFLTFALLCLPPSPYGELCAVSSKKFRGQLGGHCPEVLQKAPEVFSLSMEGEV